MDVIAEIGINDSFFLKKFIKKAKKLVGIDPILKRTNNKKKFLSDISHKFRNKFLLVGDFVENINFSEDFDKKPDLYVSNFVFEHIKDAIVEIVTAFVPESNREYLSQKNWSDITE